MGSHVIYFGRSLACKKWLPPEEVAATFWIQRFYFHFDLVLFAKASIAFKSIFAMRTSVGRNMPMIQP